MLLAMAVSGCTSADASAGTENTKDMTTDHTSAAPDTASARVRVETTMGSFTVLLYGDTPKHRDNFLKLASEGYYDGTLFHRVIRDFMVQAGDPDSKTAKPGQALGAGGPDYRIDAEIVFPAHYHKRYTLAAARQGAQVNPEKKSSGSQFYVVTGQKVPEAQLAQMEQHMVNTRKQNLFNDLAREHMEEIRALQVEGNRNGLNALRDSLVSQMEAKYATDPVALTQQMRQDYTTIGGAPHLDGAYTVFGEVVEGQDVIDKIEQAETDGRDRPREDVRIISMKVLK